MQAATARIAELEAELAEMKDRWMRAEAEMANVRARAHREVNETRQYAVQKFAQDVVEAAENLHRGLDSLPPPSRRRAGDRRRPARGPRGHRAQLPGHPGAQRHQARGPDRRAVRSQPAPGDGRAGKRGPPAGQRDARLDAGLDAERPAAAPGHGGGRQGAARRDRAQSGQGEHHRLMQSCRHRTRIPPSAPCPAGLTPIHPGHTDPIGTLAVLRAARVR